MLCCKKRRSTRALLSLVEMKDVFLAAGTTASLGPSPQLPLMAFRELHVQSVTSVLSDPAVQLHALLAPTCHTPMERSAMLAQRGNTVSLVRSRSLVLKVS